MCNDGLRPNVASLVVRNLLTPAGVTLLKKEVILF